MKKILIFCSVILLITMSCQDKQMKSEYESLKSKSQLEEQNKLIVEKYLSGWSNKDLKVLDELADPGFAFYNPSISANPMNIAQTKTWSEALFKAFPDLKYDIREILADSDKVIIWWTFSGTQKGDLWNIPSTGKSIKNSAIEIYKLQNGKILEQRTEVDGMSFFQQLGMEMQPVKK